MQIQPSQNTQEKGKEYSVFQNQKVVNFFIKSLNKQLNQFLEGGLHKGLITQIYGESGAGKTQLAMLFSISAMSSNLIVGYLATEKQLHWGRFTELAYNYMNEAEFDQKQPLFKYKKCLDDYSIQIDFLQQIFKDIEKSKKGGLIVIDNIYSLISSSFTHFKIYDSFERTRKQAQIINRLRWLAKMSNTAVLILNKVSDVIQKRRSSLGGRDIVPALGPSWQFNIDQNLQVRKGERKQNRELHIIHSPKCQQGKILFRIQPEGFVFVNQQGIEME